MSRRGSAVSQVVQRPSAGDDARGGRHTSERVRAMVPSGGRPVSGGSHDRGLMASSPVSGLGRASVIGSLVGCALSMIAVAGGVALSGGGVASLGAGILVGGFSGTPFGAMLGAMVYLGKHPED
jgi:hypothetical protein